MLQSVGWITVGPQMRAGRAIDKLRIDAHPILVTLHRTFKHITNVQFFADLVGWNVLALENERGVARDYEAVAYS